MSKIIQERRTAEIDGEVVLFMIGMRVNKLWKIHKWLPVAAAMGRMLKELQAQENSDLLHVEQWAGRTSIMVQYWRSFDALENYAKNKDMEHRPAWAKFNKLIAGNGDVGIWHETYKIKPGNFEVVYNNMPEFGLAKATRSVPAAGKLKDAGDRMKVNA